MKTNHSTRYSKDNEKYFKKDGPDTSVFSLKVPESQKTKDWYIKYMEEVVPASSHILSEAEKLQEMYDIYNGDLTSLKEQTKSFADPLGEDEFSYLEEDLLAYPKLHGKVNVLKGEQLKRNDNFKILILSANAIKDKNKKLLDAIKASVEEDVILEIEKQEAVMQGMNPEQAKQYVEELRTQEAPKDILRKNFQSEWEIFYNKALKFCYVDQDVKFKQLETIEDTILVDRCFVYSGWKFGKPTLQVRNTKNVGFHKNPNIFEIHKGDYIYYSQPLTPAEVIEKYPTLKPEELEDLGLEGYARNHRLDSRHDVLGGNALPVFDTLDTDLAQNLVNGRLNKHTDNKWSGTHQAGSPYDRWTNHNLVWETHLEFKAFQKVIYLTYRDDMNQEITVLLNDSFKIPNRATKHKFINRFGDQSEKLIWDENGVQYEAEFVWIPKKYEIIRLGDNIYPEGFYREVPFQTTDLERPYSTFELSTKGAVMTSRNADSVSLFQRAIPIYLQYLYVKHIQNRELAKYQGYVQSIDVDQIPEELGQDVDGNIIKDPVAVYLLYRKRLGIDFYSGSQSTTGVLPSTRSPGSNSSIISTAQDIFNLQQLTELLDREMGLAMGISPQREAAFDTGSNVSDNRQAITQSHHITEPYFFMHALVWKDALKDYLKNFRTYAEKVLLKDKAEHFLHYILPDGTEELLKITPTMLQMVDIGLYATNSGNDRQYAESMMQLVHAFAQNAGEGMEGVSTLVKSIVSGSSPEETHKLIQLEIDKQNQRAQAQQAASDEAQQKLIKLEIESREDQQAHEKELAHIKGKYDLEKAAITSYIGQENLDQDGDGEIDPVEIMKHRDEVNLKREDQKIKREEVASKERMKDKELKVKKTEQAQKPKTPNQ